MTKEKDELTDYIAILDATLRLDRVSAYMIRALKHPFNINLASTCDNYVSEER